MGEGRREDPGEMESDIARKIYILHVWHFQLENGYHLLRYWRQKNENSLRLLLATACCFAAVDLSIYFSADTVLYFVSDSDCT